MSGIAGRYSRHPSRSLGDEREALCGILDRIVHRGRDGLWLTTGPRVSLGIVDTESNLESEKSRCYAAGETCAVMDGEIYNLSDLTGQDQAAPGVFGVLSLITESGPRQLGDLNGEFALAARMGGDFRVARDPLGIKPLFWVRNNGSVTFASEIKALKGLDGTVEEFPPGHLWTVDMEAGRERLERFWTFPETGDIFASASEAAHAVRRALETAVNRRMEDGRISAIFLSGGLDSSIIAALAVRANPELHTVTVGMDGSTDIEHARRVADHLGTTHHEYIYDREEMLENLPEIIYHFESYDQATLRSCIANYFATILAAKHTDVILSGEGADELFAGYEHMEDAAADDGRMNSLSRRLVESMRFSGLQRLDRMVSSQSVEVRMPFLDPDLIDTALRIPAAWKVDASTGMEKWILRQAFEDLLPREVVWRTKSRFSEGAGSSSVIEDLATSSISDREFREQAGRAPATIKSKEELLYYRLYRRFYPEPELGEMVTAWRD